MKIIYIYDSIAITGGIERIFIDKMNYLADKYHHEVYLLTASQGNHPICFLLSNAIKHIDLDIRFHIQYQYSLPQRLWIKWKLKRLCLKRLKNIIKEIDPDIIICTTTFMSAEVCRLKNRAKKIIESHGAKAYTHLTDDFKMGFLKDLANKLNSHLRYRSIEKYSDMVVTLTQADAKAWQKASNVCVIPNFTHFLIPQSCDYEKRRVIAVGRLTYQKGFDRLIDAWNIVYQRHPDWKLDIFGEGIRKESLKKQIKDNNLENVITIHPVTKNIVQEYLNSSIFTLSSHYEGFALVMLEAMGCGLPCISFDCPNGPSEVIKNDKNGILIENGNIEEFAKAICHLIENKEKRAALGAKAKEEIKRYAPENIMPLWEELFNKLSRK